MFANRYTALIDACSLVSAARRDLLLSLAAAEFFRVRWSEAILDETQMALAKLFAERNLTDPTTRASRSIDAMRTAFPEALVHPSTTLIGCAHGLPDVRDEHVLAAAVQTQAQAIVTENLRDFPAQILEPLNLEARSADDFIADTIALDEGRAVAAIRELRGRMRNPAMTAENYLRSLEAHGLLETASLLSNHVESL